VTVQDFAREGLVFQIGVHPLRIDVLTGIDGVDFSSAFEDRVEAFSEAHRHRLLDARRLSRTKERPHEIKISSVSED